MGRFGIIPKGRKQEDASILACESDKTGVFNIACGRRITVNQLVDVINEIRGKDIEPVYAKPGPGDTKHSPVSSQPYNIARYMI